MTVCAVEESGKGKYLFTNNWSISWYSQVKVTLELPQDPGTDLQDLAIPPFDIYTQRILNKITEIVGLPCSLLVYSE